MKEYEFTYETLTNCIINSINKGLFPDFLKRANINPVHKKNDPLNKENYRPVSILHLASKVYESAISNQLSEYTQNLWNSLRGFVELIVLNMLYLHYFKQRELDKSGNTILMDLWKAYGCIPHDLPQNLSRLVWTKFEYSFRLSKFLIVNK